jgi:glucose-1-phosphate thymidylyltransferase
MKGIILAGGTGSRLWPNTISVSKQLLPVYDKPLIYYPLSTLMLAGIREVLIITTEIDQQFFQKLLGNGEKFGIRLTYEIQNFPEGLAQAFIIGEEFIAGSSVVLILGDNLLIGSGLGRRLSEYTDLPGATIFGKKVVDPHKYGVAEIDAAGKVKSLEEKPVMPKSNLAIPGMYFFDDTVCIKAKLVKKSERGELEIISILEMYLRENQLTLEMLPEDSLWMDCGTVDSLNDASNVIRSLQDKVSSKISSIEEIAYRNNWIDKISLMNIANQLGNNEYADYLRKLASNTQVR